MHKVLSIAFLAFALVVPGWAGDEAAYHIMVVNDDGVDAPGIAALVEAFAADPSYRVTVVAPSDHQSGKGSALTISG